MGTAALNQTTLAALKNRFPGLTDSQFRGQTRVTVSASEFRSLMEYLRGAGFDFLADITCVDYLHYRNAVDRFGLVYVLSNTTSGERLVVRTYLNEPALTIDSMVPLWEGANWLEREVWDMFGIQFDGHPDLRRLGGGDEQAEPEHQLVEARRDRLVRRRDDELWPWCDLLSAPNRAAGSRNQPRPSTSAVASPPWASRAVRASQG